MVYLKALVFLYVFDFLVGTLGVLICTEIIIFMNTFNLLMKQFNEIKIAKTICVIKLNHLGFSYHLTKLEMLQMSSGHYILKIYLLKIFNFNVCLFLY